VILEGLEESLGALLYDDHSFKDYVFICLDKKTTFAYMITTTA
jgi:hypothetical protein